MHSARFSQESAATLILSTLLRRRQIQLPLKDVLLSSSHSVTLTRILRNAHDRAVSKQLSVSPSSLFATQRNAALLKDLPGFFPAAPAPTPVPLQVVALSNEPVQLLRRGDTEMVSLPLTLSHASDFYRALHRERQPATSQAPTVATTGRAGVAPAALLDGRQVDGVQRDCLRLYCSPGSKDLMIVEVPALSSSYEDVLWEALFVAECTLAESGSLLAIAPHAFPPRVRDFLRWRFRSSDCAAAPHGESHYALCTSLASDFGASWVRRDDFPGLVSNHGKRRWPRRWNPYRREEARKFVISVRPGFTNAPHTKDALLRNAAQEKEREDQLRDADDAFFAVAHSMVEKGTHYSQPDD